MKNKTVKFNTKLIQDDKVYLPLSDVVKALGYKQNVFISKYPTIIEDVYGVLCVRETDYNNLLVENEDALSTQGQIEVTKIETLRSKIDCVLGFQPLKAIFARDLLPILAARHGCDSVEEYIIQHEIPEEKRKALTELMQDKQSHSGYTGLVDYLQDKERFDIEKIRSVGLDVQFLTTLDCTGKLLLDAYVVGKGIFCNITEFGDYQQWNDMYIDDNGDLILPWCAYDSTEYEERLINLSKVENERDFSKYNAIENMIWCIKNMDVDVLEDYEFSVFGCYEDTINFGMPIELLVKLIKPDAIDNIYTDRLIDVEICRTMTEFNSEKVFAEDYDN